MSVSRQAHFDDVYRQKREEGEDPGMRGNQRAVKALTLLLGGDRLLDLGCGTGAFAEVASGRFREVHGVDISSSAVHAARQRGVQAETLDAGSEVLPYADRTFDAVTALSSLQYIVDLEGVLSECRRVLRPGGQLITSVPNMRAAWRLWRLAVEGRFPRTSLDPIGIDGGTVHYFTSRTARDLLSRAGFQVVKTCGVFCLPAWLENRTDSGLTGQLKKEFFSGEVLLSATCQTDR